MQDTYEFVGSKSDFVLFLPRLVTGFGFSTVEMWGSRQFGLNATAIQRLIKMRSADRMAYIANLEPEFQFEFDFGAL